MASTLRESQRGQRKQPSVHGFRSIPVWYRRGLTACCFTKADIARHIAPHCTPAEQQALCTSWTAGKRELLAYLRHNAVPRQAAKAMCGLPSAAGPRGAALEALPAACQPQVQGGMATLPPPTIDPAKVAAAPQGSVLDAAAQPGNSEAALRAEIMVVQALQQRLVASMQQAEATAVTLDGFKVPVSTEPPQGGPAAKETPASQGMPAAVQGGGAGLPPGTAGGSEAALGRSQAPRPGYPMDAFLTAWEAAEARQRKQQRSHVARYNESTALPPHGGGALPAAAIRGGREGVARSPSPSALTPASTEAADVEAVVAQLWQGAARDHMLLVQGGGMWSAIKDAAGAVKQAIVDPIVAGAARAFRWARDKVFALLTWLLRHPTWVTTLAYVVRVFFLALCATWASEEYIKGFKVVVNPDLSLEDLDAHDLEVNDHAGDDARTIFRFVLRYMRKGFRAIWDMLGSMVNGALTVILAPLENLVPLLGPLVYALRHLMNEQLPLLLEQTLENLLLTRVGAVGTAAGDRNTANLMVSWSLLRTIRMLLVGCSGMGFRQQASHAGKGQQDPALTAAGLPTSYADRPDSSLAVYAMLLRGADAAEVAAELAKLDGQARERAERYAQWVQATRASSHLNAVPADGRPEDLRLEEAVAHHQVDVHYTRLRERADRGETLPAEFTRGLGEGMSSPLSVRDKLEMARKHDHARVTNFFVGRALKVQQGQGGGDPRLTKLAQRVHGLPVAYVLRPRIAYGDIMTLAMSSIERNRLVWVMASAEDKARVTQLEKMVQRFKNKGMPRVPDDGRPTALRSEEALAHFQVEDAYRALAADDNSTLRERAKQQQERDHAQLREHFDARWAALQREIASDRVQPLTHGGLLRDGLPISYMLRAPRRVIRLVLLNADYLSGVEEEDLVGEDGDPDDEEDLPPQEQELLSKYAEYYAYGDGGDAYLGKREWREFYREMQASGDPRPALDRVTEAIALAQVESYYTAWLQAEFWRLPVDTRRHLRDDVLRPQYEAMKRVDQDLLRAHFRRSV